MDMLLAAICFLTLLNSILLARLLSQAPGVYLRIRYNPDLPKTHRGLGFKYSGDCGIDLKCWIPEGRITLPPRGTIDISTGVHIKLPRNCWGRIVGRSSTGMRGISVLTGIIDEGYTGELMSYLHNHTNESVEICDGDRLFQLIIMRRVRGIKVHTVDTLPQTNRGDKGFGSTGK